MRDYDLEIKQFEEQIKKLQEEKKVAMEKEEIEKRRQEELNKVKEEMIESGKKLVSIRNEYVCACSDFRKSFSKVDGFGKWEGLLIDDFGVNKDNDEYFNMDKMCEKNDSERGKRSKLRMYDDASNMNPDEFIEMIKMLADM